MADMETRLCIGKIQVSFTHIKMAKHEHVFLTLVLEKSEYIG